MGDRQGEHQDSIAQRPIRKGKSRVSNLQYCYSAKSSFYPSHLLFAQSGGSLVPDATLQYHVDILKQVDVT
ncbi:MAG: hypothetical protein QOH06_5462 [Acidobacteriota bacterium]|jgi:hypothetical protein|nr:hypothetical protein [Acidobacteriota bacterium]